MQEILEHPKKQVKAFWDKNPCGGLWTTHDDFCVWIQQTEPYIWGILNRHHWTGQHVLDAGCGQGTLIRWLSQRGAVVSAFDFSLTSLKRAAAGMQEDRNLHPIHFLAADAECLPFPDGCFDVVLSIGVLHHTPDTSQGIQELRRVLKPNGLAIVMLYRTGNPKWWLTGFIRRLSAGLDRLLGKPLVIATWLRSRSQTNSVRGTALLELFGCPILKAFSNRQARDMFRAFSSVSISNHQPGFRRMADMIPLFRPLESFLFWLDRRTVSILGFYQVIEGRK